MSVNIRENKNLHLARAATLFFTRIKGVGPSTFKEVFAKISDHDNLLSVLTSKDFKFKVDLEDSVFQYNKILEKELHLVCYWEQDYPSRLREIPDSPPYLVFKGNYDKLRLENALSVVGTRKSSKIGEKYSFQIAESLGKNNISVVSGMAFGIDRYAHLGAIQAKGYTIAVLATSPDVVSPQNNYDVYKKILNSGGLIVSDCLPWDKVGSYSFAKRNRIIAGLSKAVVVVEASEKSGALITARLALDYNRDVYAIPWIPNHEGGRGCNVIIRDGIARLIQSDHDLMLDLGYKFDSFDKNLDHLDEFSKEIYFQIAKSPTDVDTLSRINNYDITSVLCACSILEINGLIQKQGVIYHIN